MMSKMKTGMYILDLIVVVGSALTLLWLVGYIQPLVIAPVDGLVTGNASLVFSFEKADRLYISTSRDFSDAQAITGENEKISLSPGTYYWKVEGLGESEIRMLTILDSVALEVRRHDGGIEVVNVGSETLNVEVFDNAVKVDSFNVTNEDSVISSGDMAIGRKQ